MSTPEQEAHRCLRPTFGEVGSPQCKKCDGDVLRCPAYYVPSEVNRRMSAASLTQPKEPTNG